MKWFQNPFGLVVGSSLMLGFAIAPAAAASPSLMRSVVHEFAGKPSIFSEAPFQTGALTRPLSPVLVPPLPEQLQPPSAIVAPVNGKVDMKLKNPTNAAISFEVLGHTEPRTLPAQSSLTLKDLPAPVGVTFRRPDGGLLNIQPQAKSTPGLLQVTFDEAKDLSQDDIALKVQTDGAVFLN